MRGHYVSLATSAMAVPRDPTNDTAVLCEAIKANCRGDDGSTTVVPSTRVKICVHPWLSVRTHGRAETLPFQSKIMRLP